MCSAEDIELLSLPVDESGPSKCLKGYCVLAIRRTVQCLDTARSEILWFTNDPNRIFSIERCAVKADAIPENVGCFLLAEYPCFPILRPELTEAILALKPTGLGFEEVVAS